MRPRPVRVKTKKKYVYTPECLNDRLIKQIGAHRQKRNTHALTFQMRPRPVRVKTKIYIYIHLSA